MQLGGNILEAHERAHAALQPVLVAEEHIELVVHALLVLVELLQERADPRRVRQRLDLVQGEIGRGAPDRGFGGIG